MPGSTGMPGLPGADGTMPGGTTASSGTGSSSGRSGTSGSGSTTGTGDDPFGGLGGAGGGGTMTAAERRAALDARLERGYAVFDGMILNERERAQNDADAAGSSVMGTGGNGGEGEGDAGGGLEGGLGDNPIIVASNNSSGGAGTMPAGTEGREGEFDNSNQPTYPPPGDIPSGDDDDVVARQLREAAMREPDPELREKLWDEYRKYTGLSQ